MPLDPDKQLKATLKSHAHNGCIGAIAKFCAWCVGERPGEGYCPIADCPLQPFSPYEPAPDADQIGGWTDPHLQVQITPEDLLYVLNKVKS